ncbi:MAG: Asp23/Gls24 family envelope stress response protein [Ruminococcus sp.]|nr:Asp23/Gls24 family envelope stress response protein [Ruminococcus sp.]
MIKIKNHLGSIGISTAYLRQLISSTAESCFGVAGLNAYGAKQGVYAMLKKQNTTKGVIIRQEDDELVVDLHITVTYGVNVGAIVDSIIHKVNYVLTQEAGVAVRSVNVYVDEMTD